MRMWPRVAPSERRRPISERRSSTEITMVLATPTPPTSNARAPSPSSSAVSVVSMACLAARASEGRDTRTSLGCSGLAVAARMPCTATTASSRVRVYTVVGYPSNCRWETASGQPTRAAKSSSAASGTGCSTPTTVNHWPPSHTWVSGEAVVTPSRLAAFAPSTTAGYCAVASLRKAPLAMDAPTVPSRLVRAASAETLPVSFDGMWSLRYTWTDDSAAVAVTEVTGGIRPIIATESAGRCDCSPPSVWPGVTTWPGTVTDRATWAPPRWPRVQRLRWSSGSAAGRADELLLDRRHRQQGPVQRPPAGNHANHVRTDAGQPLRRLTERQRLPGECGLLRSHGLQQDQVGAAKGVEVRGRQLVADQQRRAPRAFHDRYARSTHRTDVDHDELGSQRGGRAQLDRPARGHQHERVRAGAGAAQQRFPDVRPSSLDDDLRAQRERAQDHQLCGGQPAEQRRPGRLAPEETYRHRIGVPVDAEHQAGVADRRFHRGQRLRARLEPGVTHQARRAARA